MVSRETDLILASRLFQQILHFRWVPVDAVILTNGADRTSFYRAAAEFLTAWTNRNTEHRSYLAEQFGQHNVLHDLPTSARVASWAYQQTFEARGLTWRKLEEMVPLPVDWRRPIVRLLEPP